MTLFWLVACGAAAVEGLRPRRTLRIVLLLAALCGSLWDAGSLVNAVRGVALREPTVELAHEPDLDVSDAAYLKGVYEMGNEASSIILRLLFPVFLLSWLLISDMVFARGRLLHSAKADPSGEPDQTVRRR